MISSAVKKEKVPQHHCSKTVDNITQKPVKKMERQLITFHCRMDSESFIHISF